MVDYMPQHESHDSVPTQFPTFKKLARPFNIVRITAWLLILYGVSPVLFAMWKKFAFGSSHQDPLGVVMFLPVSFAAYLYIFIGSLRLLESGYWLLYRNQKGISTGGSCFIHVTSRDTRHLEYTEFDNGYCAHDYYLFIVQHNLVLVFRGCGQNIATNAKKLKN